MNGLLERTENAFSPLTSIAAMHVYIFVFFEWIDLVI